MLLDARAGILFEDAGAVVCAAWVDSVGCSRRRCAQYSSRYVLVDLDTAKTRWSVFSIAAEDAAAGRSVSGAVG